SYDVETHILDFEGNIYGKRIRVYFEKSLGETKFLNSITDLKRVIQEYIEMWQNEEVNL
ncbi:MAG: riboflavin kinase, partial [Brevinematia bacterium]